MIKLLFQNREPSKDGALIIMWSRTPFILKKLLNKYTRKKLCKIG